MKKTKKNMDQIRPGTKSGRCLYCSKTIIFRSADGIYKENNRNTMLYVCSGYPICDAYVRVIPGTKVPVGSMANGNLRALRKEAHAQFDKLYLTELMTRSQAYEWLAGILQVPLSKAHIGQLGEYYCRQIIAESQRLLENRHKTHSKKLEISGEAI